MNNKILGALGLIGLLAPLASAQGTAYFTMPADFSDNVQATITGVAGVLLVALGLMFAWRKTVKSTNRS
jgi:hypothetical protein